MQTGKMWAVEYSVNQKCFHVELLEDYLTNNIRSITQNTSTDYQLIAICETRDKAREFVKHVRTALAEDET